MDSGPTNEQYAQPKKEEVARIYAVLNQAKQLQLNATKELNRADEQVAECELLLARAKVQAGFFQ